jgi:hypothetical protein
MPPAKKNKGGIEQQERHKKTGIARQRIALRCSEQRWD